MRLGSFAIGPLIPTCHPPLPPHADPTLVAKAAAGDSTSAPPAPAYPTISASRAGRYSLRTVALAPVAALQVPPFRTV